MFIFITNFTANDNKSSSRFFRALKNHCVIAIILGFFWTSSIAGESVRVFESTLQLKTLEQAVQKCLHKIDKGNFSKQEETRGFSHRYTSNWFAPYDYDIYLGTTSNKQTLLRLEGSWSHVLTIARIFESEGVLPKESVTPNNAQLYKPEAKSHWIAQSINLVSPSLSLFYQAYESPTQNLTRTLVYSFLYATADALAIGIGGTLFFTRSYDARENLTFILAWLGINRGIGAVHAFYNIRGHNHLIRFQYTFPIP